MKNKAIFLISEYFFFLQIKIIEIIFSIFFCLLIFNLKKHQDLLKFTAKNLSNYLINTIDIVKCIKINNR